MAIKESIQMAFSVPFSDLLLLALTECVITAFYLLDWIFVLSRSCCNELDMPLKPLSAEDYDNRTRHPRCEQALFSNIHTRVKEKKIYTDVIRDFRGNNWTGWRIYRRCWIWRERSFIRRRRRDKMYDVVDVWAREVRRLSGWSEISFCVKLLCTRRCELFWSNS